MLRNFIYICVFLLILSRFAFSQNQSDSTYSDFGVSIGLNSYQIKENVLNPIRHTGLFPVIGFSYEWSKGQIKQKAEIHLTVNMLKSRYEDEPSPIIIDPSLSYTQVRKFSDFNPDLQLFLGGTAGLYSHMGFFDNWDDSHIYWSTYYHLGFTAMIIYQDPLESSGYLEINMPLISLVSRPPERFLYKVVNEKFSWILSEIHRDLTFTSIHQHFVLNLDLGYKFKHSPSFSQKVFWRMSYMNTSKTYSKDLTIMINVLATVLLF